MLFAIWYHLYNLKNVKKSMKLKTCNFTKSNTPPWVFSRFLNCANGTKSRNTSHMALEWVNTLDAVLNNCVKSVRAWSYSGPCFPAFKKIKKLKIKK